MPRFYFLVSFIIIALFISSCRPSKPEHLGKEEMQRVMVDIQLAEVYSTMAKKDSSQTQGLKNTDSLASFYQEVFKHHHTSADQFIKSLNWYRAHPEELDSVYAKSMKTLDIAEGKK